MRITPLSIDITNFTENGVVENGNILTNREDIRHLLKHIDTQSLDDHFRKIEVIIDCLAQVMNSSGRFKGHSESVLKSKFFEQVKLHKAEGWKVVNDERFKENSHLKETIEKAQYLSLSYFGKYYHHLKHSLGDNKKSGTSYFTTGVLAMIGGAGLQVAIASGADTSDSKIRAAWATFTAGALMTAYPILNPFKLALYDEPYNP